MIDNGSLHSDELEIALKKYGAVRRLKYRRHSRLDYEWADIIILSGSHIRGSFTGLFNKETTLVLTSRKPIIGICYGFELIASAFGDTIKRKKVLYDGVYDVTLLPELLGSEYKTRYAVVEAHHWVLESTSLEPLGFSERGIEALRHPTRPIFGLQFHPEVTVPKNEGAEILRRLLHYVALMNPPA